MTPRTFLVGVTQPDGPGVLEYLNHTGQQDFIHQFAEARDTKAIGPLCLVSFFAKLCYKSLVLGKNANVSRVRDIEDNLIGCFGQGHGSVFEHVWLNFVTTDCSRVFTHELVRHRVGTAFSQTSGRYVSIDKLDLVLPPEIESNPEAMTEVAGAQNAILRAAQRLRQILIPEGSDFAHKKRMTSAIRRIAPNGQTNEIGWSCNVRSLRHMIEMRTSPHAEWEIRVVFDEVARIVEDRWPLMLHGAKKETIDGLASYTGLKV